MCKFAVAPENLWRVRVDASRRSGRLVSGGCGSAGFARVVG